MQMAKYGRAVRRSYEAGGVGLGRDIPMPSLPGAQSLVAVPAMAMGQLVGVLAVETTEPVAFDATDQELLSVIATLVANAVETDRVRERDEDDRSASPGGSAGAPTVEGPVTHVRCFAQDGSVFVDGDYLIKGVAGRILWSLLTAHDADGRTEFTNRELRLDTSLGLPEYRDNLESRLILLKRRLDERESPVRIEKSGRGRFRLVVHGDVRLEAVGDES
jgi:hypothetical protein